MAQAGFTPLLIYGSGTNGNTPSAGNLTTSAAGAELAINYFDGKLFYKDNSGVVQVLATKATGSIGGSNTQVQYNSSGALAGSVNLTFDGTTLTANALTLTNALTTANGGTGLSSFTAGDITYYATGTALTKLAIGATGRYLSSSGTAPQWTAPAALTKTDDTNVTLTLGGSAATALLNAASITAGWTGQLSIARGGTNATATPTAGAVAYGTGTAYAFTSAGSSGQPLLSGGVGVPTFGTLATGAGGTGLTSYTAGDLIYYASGTAFTKLGIGASTTILTSTGSAPQWSTVSGITVGTATNLAGGTGGSVPYQSSAGATTFLGIGSSTFLLTSTGSAPQWSNPTGVTVGTATNAVNTGVTANATNATNYLTFVSNTTGNLPQLVNSSISCNPSTGSITGGIAAGTF